MLRLLAVFLVAAGCGRIGFDAGTSSDLTTDAEVLTTTDGTVLPSSWQLAPVQGPTATLWALQAYSPTDIWVAGTNGYIGHFNGTSWNASPSGVAGSLFIFWPASATDLWLVGQQCTLLRWQGATWQPVVAQGCTGNKALNSIDGTSTSNIWVVGEQGTILAYNGSTWADHSQGNLSYWDVHVNSSMDVLVSGTLGTILNWNGSTLVNEAGAPSATLAAFAKVGAGEYWVVGGNGAIAHKQGSGSWQPVASPVASGTLYSIYATNSSDIWAVGTGGVIIHYDGIAWLQVQSPTTKTLRNIAGIPGGGIIAVGDSGVVLTHP